MLNLRLVNHKINVKANVPVYDNRLSDFNVYISGGGSHYRVDKFSLVNNREERVYDDIYRKISSVIEIQVSVTTLSESQWYAHCASNNMKIIIMQGNSIYQTFEDVKIINIGIDPIEMTYVCTFSI